MMYRKVKCPILLRGSLRLQKLTTQKIEEVLVPELMQQATTSSNLSSQEELLGGCSQTFCVAWKRPRPDELPGGGIGQTN